MGWFLIVIGVCMVAGGSIVTYYGQQLISAQNHEKIIKDTVREVITYSEQIPLTVGAEDVTLDVETSTLEILDNDNNSATIEISVLSREAHWSYESTNDILLNDQKIDMVAFFESTGIQSRFNNSLSVIAVGAASEQGDVPREEKRAGERANQLLHWLRQAVSKPDVKLYTLNLGRFLNNTGLDQIHSSSQRRVVIISVTKMDENINISEALRKELGRVSSWPFKINEYSLFKLESAT